MPTLKKILINLKNIQYLATNVAHQLVWYETEFGLILRKLELYTW